MKNKKRKTLYLSLGIVAVLVVVLFVVIITMGNSKGSMPLNERKVEKLAEKGIMVEQTFYCDLYYPNKWDDNIIIEEKLNVVHFRADFGENKKVDLFDIVAIEDSEKKNSTEMYVVIHEINFTEAWTDEEKQKVKEMQKDASFVVDYLEKDGFEVIYDSDIIE